MEIIQCRKKDAVQAVPKEEKVGRELYNAVYAERGYPEIRQNE
jgi:hypothetical protein